MVNNLKAAERRGIKSAGVYTNGKQPTIIVIGTSAGGFEALIQLCKALPADLDAAVFAVWHLSEESAGVLPKVLDKQCKLPVTHAADGENIKTRHIYIAPPNKHLMLEEKKMRVIYGPKENRFRPAIDPLFRSAAYSFTTNVIGVILTGMLNDGTAGLWAVKDRSGITVVQDPEDAFFNDMPLNAINNVKVDHIVPLSELPGLLVKLSKVKRKKKKVTLSKEMEMELKLAMDKNISEDDIKKLGDVTEFTCPECSGSLWKMNNGNIIRFRCRTGHAFTSQALLQELAESVERNLWSTTRGLEETASLVKYLIKKSSGSEKEFLKKYITSASRAERQANKLRNILMDELNKISSADKNVRVNR